MPAVQHQKSHYLLPLNSMIFKSKSSTNLPSTNQRNIYTKSTTTLAQVPLEQPDDELTALPLPPLPTKLIRRQPKTQGLAPSLPQPQISAEHLEGVPHPALRRSKSVGDSEGSNLEGGNLEVANFEGDKKKESVWRRLIEAVKKPFRKDKEAIAMPKDLVIGGPTDFKHVRTGIDCLPGQPVRRIDNDGDDDEEELDASADWETVRPSESVHG